MNAPHSRKSASAASQLRNYDRDNSTGVSGRTHRGNYAVPAGRSHNALPHYDTTPRRRMKNLSANNRIENFSHSGAGGDSDVFSRTRYDEEYTRLYARLAQNAYSSNQGKAPGWSKCC